jgi:hypothetical protein
MPPSNPNLMALNANHLDGRDPTQTSTLVRMYLGAPSTGELNLVSTGFSFLTPISTNMSQYVGVAIQPVAYDGNDNFLSGTGSMQLFSHTTGGDTFTPFITFVGANTTTPSVNANFGSVVATNLYGAWAGSTITVAQGGTGVTSFASEGAHVYYNGTTLASGNIVGAGGNVTVTSNTNGVYQVGLSGTVPIANGGTNTTSFATANALVFYNGTALASGGIAAGNNLAVTSNVNGVYSIGIAAPVTVPNGGTGAATFATTGAHVFYNGSALASGAIAGAEPL